MPSRFYLHASGSIAAPNNPAFDANWEQTGQMTRLPMDLKAVVSALTALTNSSNITVPITTTQDIGCYQHVSNQIFKPVRLDASVLFSMVIRALESATTANCFLAYSLRAFSADGLTALATLASSFTNTGTEYAATAATRIFGNGTTTIALTAATLNQPWRLVLDHGVRANAPTAATTYLHRVGCNAASDFALTSALTTDLNPWMELSVNLNAMPANDYQFVKVGNGMGCSERIR